MRLPAIIALLALLPLAALPALAADEPEAVYAKFHRAAISRNLEELLRYGPDARRAELGSMSDAQKEAVLKMAASMMPRAFTVRSKQVAPNGRSARLVVSGTGENLIGGRPETLFGEISMVMERGQWKVDESSWSNQAPANVPAAPSAKPGAAPAAAKAPAKAAARPQSAPVSQSPAPARTLGAAKPPCVYKAVMTAEDVENCK
jgi:hypothetical protein